MDLSADQDVGSAITRGRLCTMNSLFFRHAHLRISSRILRTIFQQLVQTVCAEVKTWPMKKLRHALKASHPAWDRRYEIGRLC